MASPLEAGQRPFPALWLSSTNKASRDRTCTQSCRLAFLRRPHAQRNASGWFPRYGPRRQSGCLRDGTATSADVWRRWFPAPRSTSSCRANRARHRSLSPEDIRMRNRGTASQAAQIVWYAQSPRSLPARRNARPWRVGVHQTGIGSGQDVVIRSDRTPYLGRGEGSLEIVAVIEMRKNASADRPVAADNRAASPVGLIFAGPQRFARAAGRRLW